MLVRQARRLVAGLIGLGCLCGLAAQAEAFGLAGQAGPDPVNLIWRPGAQTVEVGDTVRIGLYAVANGDFDHTISSMTAVLQWDPQVLRLIDNDDDGPYPWLVSAFPNSPGVDPDGLNNVFFDGNALYAAFGQLAPEPLPIATTGGLLVTTFLFRAVAPTPFTTLDIEASLGGQARTEVFDGIIPGTPVTGTLGSAVIKIVPEPATLTLLLVGAVMTLRRKRR